MKTREEIIASAVRTERETALFYRMVAGMVDDAVVRAKLEELANDEEGHALALCDIHLGLTSRAIDAGEAADPEGRADLFEFSSRSLEEVLEFAVDNEQKAHALYQTQSEEADDAKAAKIFRMLAEHELGHAAYLRLQLDRLRGKTAR